MSTGPRSKTRKGKASSAPPPSDDQLLLEAAITPPPPATRENAGVAANTATKPASRRQGARTTPQPAATNAKTQGSEIPAAPRSSRGGSRNRKSAPPPAVAPIVQETIEKPAPLSNRARASNRPATATASQARTKSSDAIAAQTAPASTRGKKKTTTPPPARVKASDVTDKDLPPVAPTSIGSMSIEGASRDSSRSIEGGGWRQSPSAQARAAHSLEYTPLAAGVEPVDVVPAALLANEPAAHEPEYDHFFRAGEAASANAYAEHERERASDRPFEIDVPDPKLARKNTAAAAERRAKLSKYVKWAVAGSAALCLVAFVRFAVTKNTGTPVAAANATTSEAASRLVAEPPKALPPAPPSEVATNEVPQPANAAEPQPQANAAQAANDTPAGSATGEASSASAATQTQPPEPDPKAAATEKAAARRSLEFGKADAAIESGEKSVSLDPTDAEAWLILGAAYQAKGKMPDARRCFQSCIKEGKRGPRGECTAMLRN